MSVDQYISSGILELYAVHALPAEEMREVESMAEKHSRIREELDLITEGLKKYSEIYSPERSKDLLKKIESRIKEASEKPKDFPEVKEPVVVPIQKEKKPVKPVKPAPAPAPAPVKVRETNTGLGRMAYLMAASILLLVSIGFNIYLYSQYNNAQNKVLALEEEKSTLAENNKSLKTNFDQVSDHLKLYTDPANKMVMLKGMPVSPVSEVMVMWNTNTNDVFVEVHKLPPPPDGMQYQLWAIDQDGKPVDAGMLIPYKEQVTHGPQPMKKVTGAVAFAITLEKRGGSPTPSIDKMYVKGDV
jgi:anti-sigma-K factor RskA/cell division protein FtsL